MAIWKNRALLRNNAVSLCVASSLAILALSADTGAIAQNTADSLNLPTDMTIFEDRDPHLHKPTAVVNGEIITQTDIEQRLALIVLANGGSVSEEELARLRQQVLRNLIDETLQIQEAAANDIIISKSELEQNFARIAENFRQSPEEFSKYLRSQGSSAASISRQREAELAWGRLLRQKVQPFVNVSEEEVQSEIDRMKARKGSEEFRVSEIYLSATPENAQQVFENGRKIVEQIRQGGSFAAYARQYSEASTAAVGGDLDWVRPGKLPDALEQAVTEMDIGQIAGPIQIPGGFSILYLMDKRKVLTADPRDAVLSLKQIYLTFPKGTTRAQAQDSVERFQEQLKSLRGCGSVAELGSKLGADIIDNDNNRIRDLPAPLQPLMLDLPVGQATPVFGSIESRVSALVLCGRDDPQDVGAPTFDQVMAQKEDERIGRRARNYLRDLRRDAIID